LEGQQLFALLQQASNQVIKKGKYPKGVECLGVPDRYVDAFQGRTPKTVLARHYSDFRLEKMREVYEKANLRVL
jgi:intergrase/recombinase